MELERPYFGARLLILWNISVFVLHAIGIALDSFLSSPDLTMKGEYWRAFTGNFVPIDKRSAVWAILVTLNGLVIENKIGSGMFLWTIFCCAWIIGAMEIAISQLLMLFPIGFDKSWTALSGGFGAVGQALSVLLARYERRVNLHGFSVPTWLAPYIWLLISVCLNERVSLVGHISGVITGYLWWGLCWLCGTRPAQFLIGWRRPHPTAAPVNMNAPAPGPYRGQGHVVGNARFEYRNVIH